MAQARGNGDTYDYMALLSQLENIDAETLRSKLILCPGGLTEQVDERGFTLLHHSVLASNAG